MIRIHRNQKLLFGKLRVPFQATFLQPLIHQTRQDAHYPTFSTPASSYKAKVIWSAPVEAFYYTSIDTIVRFHPAS